MSGVAGKTQLFVDTTTPTDADAVAAYLADVSGNFLTSQIIQAVRRLDVNVASERAEDTAHTTGDFGTFTLAVRNDAGTALAADGDYIPFMVNSAGALYTTASFSQDFTKLEDSVAADGDRGAFVLGVRRDTTGALTSADGDYSELQTWSNGELKTADLVNLTNLQQVISVGVTAVALPTTPLATRKLLFVQNISNAVLYVGSATVTNTGATRGLQLGKGGYVSVDAGPANAIFGVASSAASDVVVWEHN